MHDQTTTTQNNNNNYTKKTHDEILQELWKRTDCDYLIVCHSNRMALDGNTALAKQLNQKHRRPWLNNDANFCLPSQYWRLVQIDEEIKSYKPCFLLGMMLFTTEPLCLDGNVSRHIPQVASKYPAPFLWGVRDAPKNHQWLLEPITDRGPNVFALVNCANGKCLDGNVLLCAHADEQHRAPFLAPFRSLAQVLPSQCWELTPVPRHLMSRSSSTAPFLSNGIYQITSCSLSSSSAANAFVDNDENDDGREQLAPPLHPVQHSCLIHSDHGTMGLVDCWQTPAVVDEQSSSSSSLASSCLSFSTSTSIDLNNTLWRVTLVHNNQFMIEKYNGYSTNNRLFISHEPESDNKMALKCSSGIGATERGMFWQLFQSELETSSTFDPNAFFVVNVENGQCWDSDDCKMGLNGFPLAPPSLSLFDYRKRNPSCVWVFRKQE